MRYSFDQIFEEGSDGSLTPRVHIKIRGMKIGPGISFGSGIGFGGVNIFDFKGMDIEADKDKEGVFVLKGFYQDE